ncbi:trypsin-like serine protease [Candidatus Paracaedibacter symbiosus]|uniref:trypsin-like serine protease n=1 Tax=Candidatus Paracaedibacter symbiosus TaxID=244582 RepID=UPI00068ED633|nr:trypsin-like peptidase domain-containing protein [Candidatus Paracaedibacter symbiosus]
MVQSKTKVHFQQLCFIKSTSLCLLFLFSLIILAERKLQAASLSGEMETLLVPVVQDLRSKDPFIDTIRYKKGNFEFREDLQRQIWLTSSYEPPKDYNQAAVFVYKRAEPISIPAVKCEKGRCEVTSVVGPTEQMGLTSQDRRERIFNTHEWPYSMHGHLLMTFGGEIYFTGSGVLIGPNHVLTAAHNLYDRKRGRWAKEVIFTPGRDGNRYPFGDAKGTLLLCTQGWKQKNDKQHYDFGMVILDDPIGYFTGWSGIACAADNVLKSHKISVTGYPGDKGEGDFKSTQMWTMEDELKRVDSQQLAYDIDTHEGQSGSAVWSKWEEKDYEGYYTVGVHTDKGSQRAEENLGVRLSYSKFQCLLEWLKEYQLLPWPLSQPLQLYESYKKRAKKGEPHAQYQLGRLYYLGDGKDVKSNPEKAFLLFAEAAKKHAGALCALGRCYEEGRGVEKNPKKAFDLYEQGTKKRMLKPSVI